MKHGKCGPVKSFKIQRQVNAQTPVSYRLEKVDNGNFSVGYIRLKEFNALARKDLVIGKPFHVVTSKLSTFGPILLSTCVYVTHFYSLWAAMKRLQDKGASYFVMDLRDNLGGLVQVHYTTVT